MTSQNIVAEISIDEDLGSSSGNLGLDALAAPELDVLFRYAERVDRESAWFGHVPFAHWLIRAAQPKLLVELGTHAGISYAAFCQAIEADGVGTRCYAVDTWKGDDQAGHYSEEIFTDLSEYHDRRYAGFSQMLRCTFDEARDMFCDSSVDLLHIDGLHTYEAVKHDFEGWLPKLSKRGIVLFHDTNERRSDFGVWRLWSEISEQWPSFEFVHGHGLGVLCVGAETPEALRTLCSLQDTAAAAIRTRFARLGERWETESRAILLGRGVAARDAHIANLDAAAHSRQAELALQKEATQAATERAAQADAALQVAEAGWAAEMVQQLEKERAAADRAAELAQRLEKERAAAAETGRAAETARQRVEQHAASVEKTVVDLRSQLMVLRDSGEAEIARLRQKSEDDFARLQAASAQTSQVMLERDALLNSTAWQVTWPARRLANAVPSAIRRNARQTLRAVWWTVTPWGMSRRLHRRKHTLPAVLEPTPNVSDGSGDIAASSVDLPAVLKLPTSVPGEPDGNAAPDIKLPASSPDASYATWIREFEACETLSPPIRHTSLPAPGEKQFSFLMADASDRAAVEATLRSLRTLSVPHWELLIPVFKAQPPPKWEADEAQGRQIVLVPCATNAEKGEILNNLLMAAQGSWIAVLDAGDILAPAAIDYVETTLLQAPGAAVIYSDDDEGLPDGNRQAPLFKPDWSPELLQAFNYFGRLTLLSRSIAVQAGGFVAGDGAGAEWGLNLRAADAAVLAGLTVERISRVLCHRASGGDRDRPAPTTAAAAQRRATLCAFWASRGIEATVETQPDGTLRSSWSVADPPLVSVIIPNRNSPAILRQCLEGVLDGTAYTNVEIVIVENHSDDPQTWEVYEAFEQRANVQVIRVDRKFNYSAACNRGAAVAKGALLLFLNNDIEVIDPGWLGELVRMATLPGVGIVGTKLRYPSGVLQHAGVAVGIHLFGLMFHRGDEAAWGVFGSCNHTRNWSAIMGACQMVRREVFDFVGGFDEAYQVANSDVALCLQAQRAGWRTAYTPFAALVHHEGMTRGHVNPAHDMKQSAREVQRLGIVEDPYLHPQLSGIHGVPRLRSPGEPSLREMLQIDMARVVAAVPKAEAPLNLFDNSDVESACGLPVSEFSWPPQATALITDTWTAARWILDLLRSRTDLRRRFPQALSAGAEGAFATWLSGDGLGLPEKARSHILAAFKADLSARVRQYYFWCEDVHSSFPLGLLPAGRRNLMAWMLQHRSEGLLRLEEIWWFFLQCAENPAAELVRTYLFTASWQEAHPYGLTVFGSHRFAAWLSDYYGLNEDAEWLNPQAWPILLAAEEQIRLAYAAHDGWRLAHPNAFEDQPSARRLLEWLDTGASVCSQEPKPWRTQRTLDETAARLASSGVNIIGHFCYPSGLRISAEAIAESIEMAGGFVSRRDIRTDPGDDPYHAEFGGLESHDITIIHTQPEPFFGASYARSDLAERMPRTYRIAYWYWELELVPTYWADLARDVDEIWVATNFVADALRLVSPVPVRTLFPGVKVGPFKRRSRQEFGLRAPEDGRFAFLFSFHMGSIMERKNPLGLIRAFRQAFSSNEPADLILKITSFGRHDARVAELRDAAEGANITVIDQVFTPDETLSLINACDAYVSLHRSEGLGLTMAEAMLLGKPVIATRYSGNLDFMDDQNSLLVDYDLVQIGRPIPPYDEAAHWAEPSVDHAARLMRQLYSDQDRAAELGLAGQRDALTRLSLVASGQRFMEQLARVKAERSRCQPEMRNEGSATAGC